MFDIRLQFNNKIFREYYGSLGITNRYSLPMYPQSNGQFEMTNKTIVNGLKKRLEGGKENWVEELPNVLWAYRTTLRRLKARPPSPRPMMSKQLYWLKLVFQV